MSGVDSLTLEKAIQVGFIFVLLCYFSSSRHAFRLMFYENCMLVNFLKFKSAMGNSIYRFTEPFTKF